MSDLVVPAAIDARVLGAYGCTAPRLAAVYEKGKRAQWNASDLDYTAGIPHGSPLPPSPERFRGTPLERYGPGLWSRYQWEFQAWMISQFLHGEQGALVAAARLVEVVPGLEAKECAAQQAADEARHVEAFARYLHAKVDAPYPMSGPLAELLTDVLSDSRWDMTMLGMQIMVEALALGAFRMADRTFADPLVCEIIRLIARDEARHVSFGVLSLQDHLDGLTRAEQAEREELTLAAAESTSRRFLLGDVWERLGVDVAAGRAVAVGDPVMVAYRRAVFSKVVSSVAHVGLLSERVRSGLVALDLLTPSGRLTA